MGKLDGRIAIITGASEGIGLAGAKLFLEEGAKVVISSSNAEKGKKALEELNNENAYYVKCDVSKEEEVINLFDETEKKFGVATIVYANAGILDIQEIHKTSLEDWNKVINVDLTGTFLTCREAVKRMLEHGLKGTILTTGSYNGLRGGANNAAYSAAKAGIMQLTRSLAEGYAKYGIRTNCVSPGKVRTKMMTGNVGKSAGSQILRADGSALYDGFSEFDKQVLKGQLLGRVGEAEEVAKVALFLASEDSSFVVGENIMVDGGLMSR
ncbi:MAG: SDR family oxidoreductase [Erysipelotrichaceae bacterium]|nr:SDR family oxidoreductase [Erysipelotrichaceae bacterium]